MKLPRALVLLGLSFACMSCRRPESPVRSTLSEMAAEARQREADALVAHLSTAFRSSDGSGREEARALLRRYFAAYEIVDVSIRRIALEQSDTAAEVRFTADLSGQPRKIGGLDRVLPSSSRYRFEMRFVPEDEEWKVAWASWTPER